MVSRDAPSDHVDFPKCPYCNQPFRDDGSSAKRGRNRSTNSTATANFASPEYFRTLQRISPASVEPSRTPSPHKRIQSGLTAPPGIRSPPDTAFVANRSSFSARHGISTAAFSQGYFENFFVEEKELGRGSKGVVLLVKHVLDGVSLGHFALKRIPVGNDHGWLEKVLIEVQLLQHLSHQNLVSYRHVWLEEMQITAFGPPVPCAFILQQFCNTGDLHEYILGGCTDTITKEQLKQKMRRRSKGAPEPPSDLLGPRRLQFDEIYGFFKDIASGLDHLHTHNYIHRDLKPNNCLLHRNGNELRVLVSDFGEVQSENQIRQSTGSTGTISYCSPEVLRVDPETGSLGNFTAKSDIFSLGMILHFLCFAKLPYQNADGVNEEQEDVDLLREEIISWVGLGELKSARTDLPDKVYIFLRRLLSLNPSNRPTAGEILQSIKTGPGLEESDRTSNQVIENLDGNSRISRIDTPPPTIATRRNSTVLARTTRQQPPSQLRFSSNQHSEDSTTPTPTEEPPHSATSLVLRSRHASPVHSSPFLPPPPVSWRQRIFWFDRFFSPQTLLTTKLALLLIKVVSVYLVCLPAAAIPKVGLSLLSIATVDLLILDLGFSFSFWLFIVHVLILEVLRERGELCLSDSIRTGNKWELKAG